MIVQNRPPSPWEAALPLQRARLVRLCRQYTGDAEAAEDLAQQTFLEAWRRLHLVYDPAGLDRWLSAIARNVCRRWTRERGERRAAVAQPPPADGTDAPAWEEALAGPLDIELDIERAELAALLDRAMAMLPPDTRQALVQRFVAESPQAEIAQRLGVSEGAVEARLQRGKITLRRLLTTTFAADAAAYGLVSVTNADWRPTRVWCPGCGQRQLEGSLRPEQGKLHLHCPGCSAALGQNRLYINASVGAALHGITTFKPAVTRCLHLIHDLFQVRATGGAVRCPSCQTPVPVKRAWWPGLIASGERAESLHVRCLRCGRMDDYESWLSLAWSLPETRRFWRQHPRMRFLPEQTIEYAGSAAVVTGFASVTDAARIEIIALRATGQAVAVNGAPYRLRADPS